MPMATYYSPGDSIPITLGATRSKGDVVLFGDLLGVLNAEGGVSGNTVTLDIRGVFSINKAAQAMTLGAVLYWDDTAKVATTTVGSNKRLGICMRDAASGAPEVLVHINF